MRRGDSSSSFLSQFVSPSPCSSPCDRASIVAEVGINFNGALSLVKEHIQAAAECGVDAVKFQTFRAEEFLRDQKLTHIYADSTGNQREISQYDLFKQTELPLEWYEELIEFSNSKGLLFFSSAADPLSADFLCSLKVPILKIASEDLINHRLLEHIANLHRPTILSTGMGDEREIRMALEIFSRHQHDQIVILHCVSCYPTPYEFANLRRIVALADNLNLPVGYSDHTIGVEASVCARALGALVIEKHFTIDKALEGPDHALSADPAEMKLLVERVRTVECMLGSGGLGYVSLEEESRLRFRRSIVSSRPLRAGTKICIDDITFKRPGEGFKPYEREKVIGKTLLVDIDAGVAFCEEFLSGEN